MNTSIAFKGSGGNSSDTVCSSLPRAGPVVHRRFTITGAYCGSRCNEANSNVHKASRGSIVWYPASAKLLRSRPAIISCSIPRGYPRLSQTSCYFPPYPPSSCNSSFPSRRCIDTESTVRCTKRVCRHAWCMDETLLRRRGKKGGRRTWSGIQHDG